MRAGSAMFAQRTVRPHAGQSAAKRRAARARLAARGGGAPWRWGLSALAAAALAAAAHGQGSVVLLPGPPDSDRIDLRFVSGVSGAGYAWLHPGAEPLEDSAATRQAIRDDGEQATVVAHQVHAVAFTGLAADTPYALYVLVDATTPDRSALATALTRTAAIPPPTLSLSISAAGADSLTLALLSSRDGTIFVRAEPGLTALDADAIVGLPDITVTNVVANTALSRTLSSLRESTLYRVHAVAQDADGLRSAPVARNAATLDRTGPTVGGIVATAGTRTATVWFVPSETGQAWLLASVTPGLSRSQVIGAAQAIVSVAGGEAVRHDFSGLAERSAYTLYVVLQDQSENFGQASRTVSTSDGTNPVVDASPAAVGPDRISVRLVSNEDGSAFLLASVEPIADPEAAAAAAINFGASVSVSALAPTTRQLTGLAEATTHHVYVAVTDAAGNSGLASFAAMTQDVTAPSVTGLPPEIGHTTAALRFHSDERSRAWLLADRRAGLPFALVMLTARDLIEVLPGQLHRYVFTGLDEATAYTLYAVVEDAAGNAAGVSVQATTLDATPPDIIALFAAANATSASLSYWTAEGGTVWLLADRRAGLSALQVRRSPNAFTATAAANSRNTASFIGLTGAATYTLYAAIEDAAGNLGLATAAVETLDATPPSARSALAVASSRSAVMSLTLDEGARVWLLASTAAGMPFESVRAHPNAARREAVAGEPLVHVFAGLDEDTAYTLYAAFVDAAGNEALASVAVRTADESAPSLSASASAGARTATLSYLSSEDGDGFFWADRRAGLSAGYVIERAEAGGQTAPVLALAPASYAFARLEESTSYTLYVAVRDAADNLALASAAAMTGDATPPALSAVGAEAGATTAALRFHSNEPARAWLLADRRAGLGAQAVIDSAQAVSEPVPGRLFRHVFSGLDEGAAYTLYAAVVDAAGNAALASAAVATLDATPPDIAALGAETGAVTSSLSYWTTEGGTVWLLADRRAGLSALQVRRSPNAFTAMAAANSRNTASFIGLTEAATYTLYAAIEDAAGNLALVTETITTLDATPPALSAVGAEAGATTAALRFHAGEPARAWLLADRRAGLGAQAIIDSAQAVAEPVPGRLFRHVFAGLDEGAAYTLYAAVVDAAGNAALASAAVATLDATPPDIAVLDAEASARTATASYLSSEGGDGFFWADRRAGLSATAVRALAASAGRTAPVTAGEAIGREFLGLEESTAYSLYLAVRDAAGNLGLAAAAVETLDATPPSARSALAVASSRSAVMSLTLDEGARVWLLASTAAGMPFESVRAHPNAARREAVAGEPLVHVFAGLDEGVAYTLYAAFVDAAGNEALASVAVRTADESAPSLSASASAGARTATLSYLSSEDGDGFFWADRRAGLSAGYVIERAEAGGQTAPVLALAPASYAFARLEESTSYTLYVAVRDDADNLALASAAAMTGDATPPALSAVGAEAGATTAALRFHSNEPARAWLLADRRAGLGAQAVIDSAQAVSEPVPGRLFRHVFSGLDEGAAYTLYAAVVDAAGNAALASAAVATLDATPPEVDALDAEAGARTATASYLSSEGGDGFFWADRRAGLSATAVRALAGAGGRTAPVTAGEAIGREFLGLEESTAYTLYLAVRDAAGNLGLAAAAVETLDATPPSARSALAVASSRSAVMSLTLDEGARVWLLASTDHSLGLGDVAGHPNAARREAVAGEPLAHVFAGLDEGAAYTLYAALVDAAGNAALASVAVRTADESAPSLSASASAGARTATLSYLSSEGGDGFFWADRRAGLSAATVRALAEAAGQTAPVLALAPASYAFARLEESTSYTLYVAVRDAADNLALASAAAMTGDATPPALSAVGAEAGATTAALRFHAGEPARAWLLADRRAGLGAQAVIDSAQAVAEPVPGRLFRHVFAGLDEGAAYTLYAAVVDAAGNAALASVAVATLDATPPDIAVLDAEAGARTATASYLSSEGGDGFFWADRRAGLSADAVRALAGAAGQTTTVLALAPASYAFARLEESTAYTLYLAVRDAAGNLGLAATAVETLDATPPSARSALAVASSRSAVMSLTLDEGARVWLLASTDHSLGLGDVAGHPNAARREAVAGEPLAHVFAGLDEGAAYTLYAAAEDDAGNAALAAAVAVRTADESAPSLSASASAGARTATLSYLSSEDGDGFFWADRRAGLSAAAVRALAEAAGRTATVTAGEAGGHEFFGLEESTSYTLYVAVRDAADNLALASAAAMTGDATPPALSAVRAEAGATTAALRFHSNEPARAWLLADRRAGLGAQAVIDSAQAVAEPVPGRLFRHVFAGLDEGAAYTLYAAVVDAAGNAALASAAVATLDATPPEVDALDAEASARTATASYLSSEGGDGFFWADRRAGLSADAVRALAASAGRTATVTAGEAVAREFLGLEESTAYTLYLAVRDAAGNLGLAAAAVETLDATPPSARSALAVASSRSAVISLTLDEGARVWLLASTDHSLGLGDVAGHPNAALREAVAGEPLAHVFAGLDEGAAYTLYAAFVDAAGNEALASVAVRTADESAPSLSASASAGARTATLSYLSSEDGDGFFWADRRAGLSAGYVIERAEAGGQTAPVLALAPASYAFTRLEESTSYTLYVAVRDDADNLALASAAAMTGDATPPALSAVGAEAGATTAALRFHSNEPARAWLLADRRAGLGAQAVIDSAQAVAEPVPGRLFRHVFAGLDEGAAYTLYAAVVDAAGNAALASAAVATLDATPPEVDALDAEASARTATATYLSSEGGDGFFWADRRAGLSADAVRALAASAGRTATVTAGEAIGREFLGLEESTAYTLYLAVRDAAGNLGLAAAAVETLDATPPALRAFRAEAGATTAALRFHSNEPARAWLLADRRAGLGAQAVIDSAQAVAELVPGRLFRHVFAGLDEGAAYTLYAAVVDAAGNAALASAAVATLDATPPEVDALFAEASARTATASYLSSEGGDGFFWADRRAGLAADAVRALAEAGGRTAPVTAGEAVAREFLGLEESTAYTLYLAVRDAAGNLGLAAAAVETLDATPPSARSALAVASSRSAVMSLTLDEGARVWLLASTDHSLGLGDVAGHPNAARREAVAGEPLAHVFAGLDEGAAYTLYAALVDAAGNEALASVAVRTADESAPSLSASASAGARTATLSYLSSEGGDGFFWADRRAGLAADAVRALAEAAGRTATVTAGEAGGHEFFGLKESTGYTLYVAVRDAAGNLALASAAAMTGDATPPALRAFRAEAGATTAALRFHSNEPARAWLLADRRAGLGAQAVIDSAQAVAELVPGRLFRHVFAGLDEGAAYTLYAAVVDAAGNAALASAAVATLDATPPEVDALFAEASARTATASYLSSEGGDGFFWADRRAGLAADAVRALAEAGGRTAPVTAGEAVAREFLGLEESTAYTLYLAVRDAAGNLGLAATAVETLDATPPSARSALAVASSRSAVMSLTLDEGARVWLLASTDHSLGLGDVAGHPNAARREAVAGEPLAHVFAGLDEGAAYTLYAALVDAAGNAALASVAVRTADESAPSLSASASAGARTATLSYLSSEGGDGFFWADRRAGLSADAVRALAEAAGRTATVTAGEAGGHEFFGLEESTGYTLYVAVRDAAGNLALASAAAMTGDATPPALRAFRAEAGATTAALRFHSNEPARAWLLADRRAGLGAQAVIDSAQAVAELVPGRLFRHVFAGLDEGAAYTLYAAVVDAAGNAALASAAVATLDATPPEVDALFAEASARTATASYLSSEGGDGFFWADRRAGLAADAVRALAASAGRTAPVTAGEAVAREFLGLEESTAYTLYLAVRDAAGNLGLAAAAVETLDATPPSARSALAVASSRSAVMSLTLDEGARVWLLASTDHSLGLGDVAGHPNAALREAVAGEPLAHVFAGLDEGAAYTLYAALVDAAGNAALASVAVRTADESAPSLSASASAGARTATLSYLSSEGGDGFFWADRRAGLSADAVRALAEAAGRTATVTAGEAGGHEFFGLEESTGYTLYVAVRDAAGNLALASAAAMTGDATPPALRAFRAEAGATTAALRFHSNEPARAWLLADRRAGLGAQAVIDSAQAVAELVPGRLFRHVFAGLDEGAAYTLYAAVVDAAGNAALASAAVATLDATPPEVDALFAEASARTATASYLSSEGGDGFFWADRRAGLAADAVRALAEAGGRTAPVTAGEAVAREFLGLEESTAYTLYLAVRDAAGNLGLAAAAVETLDATPPSARSALAVASSRSAVMSLTLDEGARVWLLASTDHSLGLGDVAGHPNAALREAVAGEPLAHVFAGLDEGAAYTLYAALVDAAGNAALASVAVRTADESAPSLSASASAGARTATLSYLSSEGGDGFFWADRRAGLSSAAVRALAASAGQTATVLALVPASYAFARLEESTSYTLYVAVRDGADNLGLAAVAVATLDATAPSLTILAAAATAATATLRFRSGEDADIWLWADVQTGLGVQTVLLRAGPLPALSVRAGAEVAAELGGLMENTAYALYVVARDAASNLSIAERAVTTPDGSAPLVEIFGVAAGATTASLRFAARHEDVAVWLLADTDAGLAADVVSARVGTPTSTLLGADQTTEHLFFDLAEATTYTLYILAEDSFGLRALYQRSVRTLDASPPAIENLLIDESTDTVSVTFLVREDGGVFFSLLDESTGTRLSLPEVAIRTLEGERQLERENRVRYGGLAQKTDYALYLLLVDVARNSTLHRIAVRTTDGIAPELVLQKLIVADAEISVTLRADEDSAARLSIDDLQYPGSRTLHGVVELPAGVPVTYAYDGLDDGATYALHIVAEDAEGNVSRAITRTVTTPPARETLAARKAVINVASGQSAAKLPIDELVRHSAAENERDFTLSACYRPAGEDCPPLPIDRAGNALVLRPGRHDVAWTLSYQHNGETVTVAATQTINVLPRVTWQPEVRHSVASTMVVRAALNGSLVDPARPLSVPFIVYRDDAGGALAGSEHALAFDGLQGSASLPAVASTGRIEVRFATEALPFARGPMIDDPIAERIVNADSIRQTLILVDDNLPPVVSLRVTREDGENGPGIVLRGDSLSVTLRVSDPNQNALRLRCDSGLLVPNLSSVCSGELVPATVALASTLHASAIGYHEIWVEVSDGAEVTRRVVQVPVVGADPRHDDADSDMDGIPDRQESLADADRDFVPDYLDAFDSNGSVIAIRRTADPTAFAMQAEEWSAVQLGEAVFAALNDAPSAERNAFLPLVSMEALRVRYGPHAGNGDDLPTQEHGLFSFALNEFGREGRANVVLTALRGLPERPRFRVFIQALGWETFSTASGDAAVSLSAPASNCPSSDDQRWDVAGPLRAGHRCMRLSIADGGPNDSDGRADGIVHVVGGPIMYTGALEVAIGGGCAAGGGAAGAPLSGLLALAWMTIRIAKRRRHRG